METEVVKSYAGAKEEEEEEEEEEGEGILPPCLFVPPPTISISPKLFKPRPDHMPLILLKKMSEPWRIFASLQ